LHFLPVDATDGGRPPQVDAERKSSAGAPAAGNFRNAQVDAADVAALPEKIHPARSAKLAMFGVYVFAGLVVAGVVIGVWRTRRSSQEIPNPFQRRPR
jgi:hypothetical protein